MSSHYFRTRVPPRSMSCWVQARGIFPGAKVVRGHDWRWGSQDGKQFCQKAEQTLCVCLSHILYTEIIS